MDSVIEDPGFASGLSSLRICLSVCPWPGSPHCSSSLLPRQGTPPHRQRSVGSEILHRDGSAEGTTLPFNGRFCYEQLHMPLLLFHSPSLRSPPLTHTCPWGSALDVPAESVLGCHPLPGGACPFQDSALHHLPGGASTTTCASPGGRDSPGSTPALPPRPPPQSPVNAPHIRTDHRAPSTDPQLLQIPPHSPL